MIVTFMRKHIRSHGLAHVAYATVPMHAYRMRFLVTYYKNSGLLRYITYCSLQTQDVVRLLFLFIYHKW